MPFGFVICFIRFIPAPNFRGTYYDHGGRSKGNELHVPTPC